MPHESPDISTQTAEIARGSREAFADWYDRWYDWCLAETRRWTRRDLGFCHDVVQDVMMTVIRAMPVMPDEARQRAWLRRSLMNRARDHLRRDLRRLRREIGQERHSAVSTVEPDRLRELQAALRRLDEASATLLRWRFDLGWTLARIARELGLSTSTADGRVRGAITKLQVELEPVMRNHES
ncbi:MAG: sigma-70 family RNA polymerase sigma factor [Phycisphaerales bacterium]|nr:sigma-70 family RNA polymerase sigma factor [Phycisphaerales bacterium]